MPFSFRPAPLAGLLIVEPRVFPDGRGSFWESYKASDFEAAGIRGPFVQDNHSVSSRGTVRGLHFQRGEAAQGKLVRVTRGRVWDVAVDLRRSSPTFGRWYGLELSAVNRLELWIPVGFAHGFLALEEGSELQYKCTAEYAPAAEGGIRWDDPRLGIAWPLGGALTGTVTEDASPGRSGPGGNAVTVTRGEGPGRAEPEGNAGTVTSTGTVTETGASPGAVAAGLARLVTVPHEEGLVSEKDGRLPPFDPEEEYFP